MSFVSSRRTKCGGHDFGLKWSQSIVCIEIVFDNYPYTSYLRTFIYEDKKNLLILHWLWLNFAPANCEFGKTKGRDDKIDQWKITFVVYWLTETAG